MDKFDEIMAFASLAIISIGIFVFYVTRDKQQSVWYAVLRATLVFAAGFFLVHLVNAICNAIPQPPIPFQ
jgi:VIT1/CCC1 family predicted Fe2+/Mn2+ transporter